MKQLEYIQSTGTQYINTNINLSAGAEIISEFEFTSVGTTYYNPVYGTQNSASPWNSFYCRYSKQYAYLNFTGGHTDDNSISINTKYSTIQKISSNTNEFWLDGNKILDSTDSNTITTEPLYIFGMRNGGDTHLSFIKLYSLIIKNCIDGTILYYFIPAKDENDVVCLYDKVSQSYFYNSGTGTFTAGKEIFDNPATELEYIESSGTQYIDTGIVCATDMDVSIEVEFPVAPSTETCIAGSGGGTGGSRMFFGYLKNGYFSYGYTIIEQTGLLSAVANTRYRIVTNLTHYIQLYAVNGNRLYSDNVEDPYTNNKNLYIFACNTPKPPYINYFASMKLYGATIWKDNVKVAEYIPALDDNGVVCLYDTVSKTYFYNSGTGTFTAGPEVGKDLIINLNTILAEKQTNILPENIKSGVTVFGVTGNYGGGSSIPTAKLFDSIANMQADPNPVLNDYATVYTSTSTPITSTTEFSSCTCPNTVVLPSAFSGFVYSMFQDISSGTVSMSVQLNSSGFSCSDFNNPNINVQYTSSDGITYTRTDGGSEVVDFGATKICYSSWDDAIGYFMQIGSTNFEGLFQYTTNNLYEIAPTQFTATTNSVASASFLGKNGVEAGNLQNPNITSLDELKEKVQVYSDLSYLGLNENITNMYTMFMNCTNLTTVPNFDTSNVTNMAFMFRGCSNLISIPSFDTSSVTNMLEMFGGCSNLISVPNFNTSDVTNMYTMFYHCSNLTTVPNFDTSNVTSMGSMFMNCNNLTSAPNFDTSKVTNMNNMFAYSRNLVSVPNFNTSNVTNMSYMFSGCNNLSNASIQNIINMCLNSNITNTTRMNLRNTNTYSPLINTPFDKSYYQNRWTELTAAGWTY